MLHLFFFKKYSAEGQVQIWPGSLLLSKQKAKTHANLTGEGIKFLYTQFNYNVN